MPRPRAVLGAVVAVLALAAGQAAAPPAHADTAAGRGARAGYDVVVYEASSGGVGAAVAAARAGMRVLLVEPTTRVGGMLTNGVTADLSSPNASTGLFDEHRAVVADLYRRRGVDDPLLRDGHSAEPDVALEAVHRLLEVPGLTVRAGWRLVAARRAGSSVGAVVITDGAVTETVPARVFVDASPVGDVLGAVGQRGRDWVVGREGRHVYGETLAPARSDDLQQAYTYRVVFQVGGRVDYPVPATYAEDLPRYRAVSRDHSGRPCVVGGKEYARLRIQRCMVRGKFDVNIDLVGVNHHYPTAGPDERRAVERRIRDFVVGWLHFQRTERGHPELGLTDDYPDNGGLPTVLYVREGRRALGRVVFVERDALPGQVEPKPTVVATGSYGLDSHCVTPPGGVSGSRRGCGGGFWAAAAHFQVPYEVMLPARFDNLLLPVPVSASHVGYSALRMESVRMNLGYAAGLAAAQAVERGVSVQRVDVRALQRRLLEARHALVLTPAVDHLAEDFLDSQTALLWVQATFRDVPTASPHALGIHAAHRAGLLPGVRPGEFRPDAPLTRRQLAVALARMRGLAPLPTRSFTDVLGPDAGLVEAATRAGLMTGLSSGRFGPALPLRRDDGAVALARLLGLPPVPSGPFADVPGATHRGGSVNALAAVGVLPVPPDRLFRPADRLRRDEAASLLAAVHRAGD